MTKRCQFIKTANNKTNNRNDEVANLKEKESEKNCASNIGKYRYGHVHTISIKPMLGCDNAIRHQLLWSTIINNSTFPF